MMKSIITQKIYLLAAHLSEEIRFKINSISPIQTVGMGPCIEKAALTVTTQNGIRSALLPLSRRYRYDQIYIIKRLQRQFSTNTLFSKTTPPTHYSPRLHLSLEISVPKSIILKYFFMHDIP